MKKKQINLSSYENVEKKSNFKNKVEIEKYRKKKIEECKSTIDFIEKKMKRSKKIKVLELGSGNSKLLYALALKNIISQGYGIEVSKSRYLFAEKWKKDLKISNVNNININALNLNFQNVFSEIDLFICVDIALQFLEPIKKNSTIRLLENIFHILNKDGFIILELMSMENIIKKIKQNHGTYRTWEEFETSDPFAYLIESLKQNKERDIILGKRFIHRKKNMEKTSYKMTNILKPYSVKKIKNILKKIGFTKIQVYKNFNFNKYDHHYDEFVIIAKK